MITGAHSVIYSKDPMADRAFLKEILKFPYVDAGQGWLIFGLPPAEVAFHIPLLSFVPMNNSAFGKVIGYIGKDSAIQEK